MPVLQTSSVTCIVWTTVGFTSCFLCSLHMGHLTRKTSVNKDRTEVLLLILHEGHFTLVFFYFFKWRETNSFGSFCGHYAGEHQESNLGNSTTTPSQVSSAKEPKFLYFIHCCPDHMMIVFREQSVNHIVGLPGFGELSNLALVLVKQGFPSNIWLKNWGDYTKITLGLRDE